MTNREYQTQFSFWCLLAAPIISGTDLTNMTQDIKDILTNKEVIAVDQDPLGLQGKKIRDDGEGEVWAKPLTNNTEAIILFNRGSTEKDITVSWRELGFDLGTELLVKDLWDHKDLGRIKDSFSSTVPPHGVVMIRIMPLKGHMSLESFLFSESVKRFWDLGKILRLGIT